VPTTEYEAVPAVAGEATARAGTVVMKFGGTSVGDPQKLKDVAARIVAAHGEGTRVVAVLSAMGDTTDELVRLAYEISPRPEPRELDMLISVGERISCALAAMAIHDLGDEAISLTGSQAGIVTDTVHGKAKIVDVRARRIHEALDQDKVVLVAGFQGVSTDFDITTLGRGGSDTTAVALAAALAASHCEIYTDVAGVFSADPRIVPKARKLHAVSYDEMLELSASGAKVLQLRSVEVARNYGVKLHVRSTFSDGDGTWVTEEDERMLEKAIISGVAHTFDEAVYRVQSVDRADLFTALADAGVNVDTIIQTGDEIVFSAPLGDRGDAQAALERAAAAGDCIEGLAKVSLIGAGMKSHPGIAARTFGTLREIGVEARFIVTSPIKIAFFVEQADAERTVLALHDAFELASAGSERDHL
jgi:aspartate kinase